MIYLLVGRKGAGKSYLLSALEKENFNITPLFTTNKSANAEDYKITDIIPENTITFPVNDDTYGIDKSALKNGTILIVDPNVMREITKVLPDEIFNVICVNANSAFRTAHAVNRYPAEQRVEKEREFEKFCEAENEIYDAFDDEIEAFRQDLTVLTDNVTCILEYNNDFTEKCAVDFARFISNYNDTHHRLACIIQDAMSLNIFKTNPEYPGKIEQIYKGNCTYSTPEQMAGILLRNNGALSDFMLMYTAASPRFEDLY